MFKNPQASLNKSDTIIFSQFLKEVENGRVVEVQIQGNNISGVLADGNKIITDTTNIALSYLNNEVSSIMDHSPFQDGFPRYSWRIISVPTIPSNNHIEGIFNESFSGPPNEARWHIYDWDFQSNEWIVPDSTIAGRAYWLKQIKLNDVSFCWRIQRSSFFLKIRNKLLKSSWLKTVPRQYVCSYFIAIFKKTKTWAFKPKGFTNPVSKNAQ